MTGRRVRALRGRTLDFTGNPFEQAAADCFSSEPDGLVIIEDGRITATGPWNELRHAVPEDVPVETYPDCILSAGFIDCHVHYPQLGMIAAHGEQLLEWLEKYTFPTEAKFHDRAHADAAARLFMRELLRAGTTTAAVYCTVHVQSVEAFFEEASRYDACMIAGQSLMDRNAPTAMLQTAQQAHDDCVALIGRWHRRGRQLYAVTPRFAPSSTEALLEVCGTLLRDHDGLYMQTHIAESRAEVEWVSRLFPTRANYLDTYAHAGLVGPRAMLGHGIHLDEPELCTCHATGAALAHCPTSNLFLGSGLFRLFDALDPDRPVRVGLGTDIGAGTSLSQLRTMGEAYKVAALQGSRLGAIQAYWLATLGAARALYLDDRLGRLAPGYAADIVVLDPGATPLLQARMALCESLEERLFVLMTLGDERAVRATYVAGRRVYDRESARQFTYAGAAA
ncbi:guanine deaminase [Lichenicoccus roseus]|uniref:Guanine deaminase n=1 Tax=Lichenicoccus roseus TaxID=2683649 RepID=A0A5R9JFD3_9PROT|nr:guanine deaminase [Lichenicoccus roseus]TLU73008.1 guanine deaminase [Lichenicoccus roseus]